MSNSEALALVCSGLGLNIPYGLSMDTGVLPNCSTMSRYAQLDEFLAQSRRIWDPTPLRRRGVSGGLSGQLACEGRGTEGPLD